MSMADAPTAHPVDIDPVDIESTSRTVEVKAGKHNPLRKTVGDIIRSMALVGAVVAAILLVTWRPSPDPVREVDPFPVANLAAREAGFKVLMPLPEDGWRSTSARLEPTDQSADKSVWFNGWVSPDSEYFALVQSAATHRAFIDEQTDDGHPVETGGSWPWNGDSETLTGWVAYESADGKNKSLVRKRKSHTTIVTSTAGWPRIEAFAANLASVKKASAMDNGSQN